jgi:hypothetical protein
VDACGTRQVQSLMNGAPMDEETGQMEYKRHLPKLTALIKAYSSPEAFAERNELSQRAEFQPAQLMGGEDKAGFDKRLKALFDEADKDHSGMLDPAEVRAMRAPRIADARPSRCTGAANTA